MSRTILDGRGRPLTLESIIGRGSFGEVYSATPENGGPSLAAKLPIPADALTELEPQHRGVVADLCQRMVRDQGKLLERLPEGLRPEVYGVVDGGGAIPCLLMEHIGPSLADTLSADLHFIDLLDVLAAASRGLQALHDAGAVHGNLKAGNIFLSEDGATRFTDPASPRARTLRDATEMLPGWHANLPPEVLSNLEGLAPLDTPAVDTFTLGKMFYQAVLAPEAVADPRNLEGLFLGPLDKARIPPFMDALEQRFERDRGNPHTRDLFMRRTQSLITRMLSQETAPSPPFRFYRATDLAARLEELKGLFHPGFEQMGPIVLDRPTGNEVYNAGEDIRFSLAFKCQGGLTNPDLLNCFVYVRDVDREQKVSGLEQEVLPVHDGTRFRCEFRLKGLDPGRYLLRVGMGIKGTPGKPTPRDVLLAVAEPPPQTPPTSSEPRAEDATVSAARPPEDATDLKGRPSEEETVKLPPERSGRPSIDQPPTAPKVALKTPTLKKAGAEHKAPAQPGPKGEPPPRDDTDFDYYARARGGAMPPQKGPGATTPADDDETPTTGPTGLIGGLSDRTFIIAAAVVFVVTILAVMWMT